MKRLITAFLLLISTVAFAQNKEAGIAGAPSKMGNNIHFSGGVPGRAIVAGFDRKAEFTEGGSVKIKIWIDRDGKIIRYQVYSASNAAIKNIAEQKIKGLRFNKMRDAPQEHSGMLILKFRAGNEGK